MQKPPLSLDESARIETLQSLKILDTAPDEQDELTSIANRRGFKMLAQHHLHLCARENNAASLVFMDLDKFKLINDCFGHREGDLALVAECKFITPQVASRYLFLRALFAFGPNRQERGAQLMS